jgi:hypothetical protein
MREEKKVDFHLNTIVRDESDFQTMWGGRKAGCLSHLSVEDWLADQLMEREKSIHDIEVTM